MFKPKLNKVTRIIGLIKQINYKLEAIKRDKFKHSKPQSKKPYYVKKSAEMPTAGEANLNKRMRSQDDMVNPNNKKVCDPHAEAKIPKSSNPPIGKRASQQPKTAILPTKLKL